MTDEERVRALIGNLKNWSCDVEPQFRIEKEDAEALIKDYADKYPWIGEPNDK